LTLLERLLPILQINLLPRTAASKLSLDSSSSSLSVTEEFVDNTADNEVSAE
jgi:hypothetical protein